MTKGCSQNNMKRCFSSLNISGVRKCKYLGRYENLELSLPVHIFKQCMISFQIIYILYPNKEIKKFVKFARFEI